jgi:hypothetical protein
MANRKNDEKSSNFGLRDFQILRFSDVEMDQVTYEIPGEHPAVPGILL